MNILLVASTKGEINATIEYLEENWEKQSFWTHQKDDTIVTTLVTGIGSMYSAFSLARFPDIGEMNYVLNPGIAAALSRTLDLARVYLVESEGFADLGIEESDGSFQDQHDLRWYDKEKHPYKKGKITPKSINNPTFLPKCSGLTVNKIPGTFHNIEYFQKKYHSDILSLSGAGIMYACRMLELELIQIKAVSRYVEPWQKAVATSKKAIAQLNMRTIDILEALSEKKEKREDFGLFQ